MNKKKILKIIVLQIVLLIQFKIYCFSQDSFEITQREKYITYFQRTEISAKLYNFGSMGHHAVWVNLNSDGCLDLFTSNTDQRPPHLSLYKNNCDGTFDRLNENTGIETNNVHIISSSFGDFDNDGLVDLLLGTNSFYMVPRLYKNLGNFNFALANDYTNIDTKSLAKSIVFVDYDLDGHLDIYQNSFSEMFLYRNDGTGFFNEVSIQAGLDQEFRSLNSSHWFDYNNDRYPDLFLSIEGYNMLYRNNGGGTFTNVTEEAGLKGEEKWNTVAACSGDIDNDGDLDFYIANIGSKRNALYLNNGDGTFTDITFSAGVMGDGDGRTCSIVDYNSDGLNDIFTTNHIRPSRLYKNLGGNRFTDVAYQAGVNEPIDAFTVSWGDYNSDSDLDLVLNGHYGHALYQGSMSNNSVIIVLRGDGTTTNTSAIGVSAVLTLHSGLKQTKTVLGSRGRGENDMLPLHFGLGQETEFGITVTWTNGDKCSFEKIDAKDNRFYKIYQKGCRIETN